MTGTAAAATLPGEVVDAIRTVVGDRPAVLHEPVFAGNEWEYLKECLDSTFVSSVGEFVDRFERDLAEYTGARRAVAVVNGTAALHMALLLCGVEPGDEVLCPTLSFVATCNAVRYCGAIPHFVDSEEGTLGLDPAALREYLRAKSETRSGVCVNRATGNVIRAVVPMHTFGHPMNIESLLEVAGEFHLAVVEDAAEALGSRINGVHAGTFGRIGTLSFNGNKTVTTGGGGALLFNDLDLARRAKHLTTTAKVPHRWDFVHDAVGYNYRMPNLNAALGCAQLEQLPGFIAAKRSLFDRYSDAFAGIRQCRVFREPAGCTSNYWLQTLVLDKGASDLRDSVLEATNDAGFMTRPVWRLMHKLEPFRECPRMDLTVAESLESRLINLPSSANITPA